MTPLTDARFDQACDDYARHMARFVEAHAGMPSLQRQALIELERRDCWRRLVGGVADILSPPILGDIQPIEPGSPLDGLFDAMRGREEAK